MSCWGGVGPPMNHSCLRKFGKGRVFINIMHVVVTRNYSSLEIRIKLI